MSVFLKKTDLNDFTHRLCNGEQIVRNPKINALIGTKLSGIPDGYKNILAHPVFTGEPEHESIMWQSDQFSVDPEPLSELRGEKRQKYECILQDAMAKYASAVSVTAKPTQDILTQAITYHSLDNVFCGEDKIAITEWGMFPKDNPQIVGILGIDVNTIHEFDGDSLNTETDSDVTNDSETEGVDDSSSDVVEDISKDDGTNRDSVNDSSFGSSKDKNNADDTNADNIGNHDADTPVTPPIPPNPDNIGGFWKKWWKRIIGIIALLLALIITVLVYRRCSEEPPVVNPVNPDVDPEDITISNDSLTMEVNNRVIILITNGGTVNEFVKEFRKVYPDESKYRFANPDTLLPRIVLILPKEEKAEFTETLQEKFPEWELDVLPETVFEGSKISVNDPAMSDDSKRWYFDMCSVFDAWEVTMGSPDIVVAVIDDGFDLSHPEIKGKVVGQYNAVYHNTKIYPTKAGHGMHVAATAVGLADNGKGSAGIAPKCKLMPIQVADRNGVMTTSAIVDAVLYAIQKGANVVNMSLGMCFSGYLQYVPVPIQRNLIANNFLAEERMWRKIFDMAEKRNVTFVLAGGNENVLIGLDPMQRSNKTIKVSAVGSNKYKADFSNFGEYSTLSAPGIQIYNAFPGNRYTFMSGTSMASPIVAGGVALLKSKDKSLTTSEIINILRETGISSPSAVGPIVNFAKALNAEPVTGIGDCDEIQRRYNELLEELERLKREHPDCIADPDTLTIPVGADITDISGTWMSTTRLYNHEEEDVVLYFTFNGTSKGTLTLVEPDKSKYVAPLSVSVKNDKIYIRQTAPAVGPDTSYPPYSFVCKPDKSRHADCTGQNLTQASNKISFKLVRLNN